MATLKIVKATGFTKEEALLNSELAGLGEAKFDATTAVKNDKELKELNKDIVISEEFAAEYIQSKVKGAAGIVFSVVLEAGSPDKRERPYTVETIVTEGSRKYTTVYEGLNSDNQIVFTSPDKASAEKAAKAYVTENKRDVTVRLAKLVTVGEPIALKAAYTPSVSTKLGTYVFFANV